MLKNTSKINPTVSSIINILSSQYKLLVLSGSNEEILKYYKLLLNYLKTAKVEEIDRIFYQDKSQLYPKNNKLLSEKSDADISNISIQEAENIITNKAINRKYLERIAIHRFGVSQGSIQSLYNKQMLIEKLLTLISNERTHATIKHVAQE